MKCISSSPLHIFVGRSFTQYLVQVHALHRELAVFPVWPRATCSCNPGRQPRSGNINNSRNPIVQALQAACNSRGSSTLIRSCYNDPSTPSSVSSRSAPNAFVLKRGQPVRRARTKPAEEASETLLRGCMASCIGDFINFNSLWMKASFWEPWA